MIGKYDQERVQLITVQIQTLLKNIDDVCESQTMDDFVVTKELGFIRYAIEDCVIPARMVLEYMEREVSDAKP